MNKKLLLLPITLMSSFLGACTYRTEHIPLNEIFTISTNGTGYYYMNDEYYKDFDDGVFNILKTNLGDAKLEGNKRYNEDYRTDSVNFTFYVENRYKKMDYFSVQVYVTGYVETYVSGSGWLVAPENQQTLYTINKETAKKVYQEVVERTANVKADIEAEKHSALEAHSLDKFFTTFSNMKYRQVEWMEKGSAYKEPRVFYDVRTVEDKDGDILEALTTLEYNAIEPNDFYSFDDTLMLKIELEEEDYTMLRISSYSCMAQLVCSYESKYYGLCNAERYYTVNREKLDNLFQKVHSKIEVQ